MKRAAAIILNYNSNQDLFDLLPMVERQTGCSAIIIVDNDSREEYKKQLGELAREKGVQCLEGTTADFLERKNYDKGRKYYIVYHDSNMGFSAGNNVGIKLAERLGMEYCLLLNPDMRIQDQTYVEMLVDAMEQDEDCVMAGSCIKDMKGEKQNPVRPAAFYEELFWFGIKFFKHKRKLHELRVSDYAISTVPQINGCCMLLRTSFMKEVGYLDEGVFMYCEEPILSAKVRREGKKILYVPYAKATHAHIKSEKASTSNRMLQFLKSRLYYIDKYSKYNKAQKALLHISYGLCRMVYTLF